MQSPVQAGTGNKGHRKVRNLTLRREKYALNANQYRSDMKHMIYLFSMWPKMTNGILEIGLVEFIRLKIYWTMEKPRALGFTA